MARVAPRSCLGLDARRRTGDDHWGRRGAATVTVTKHEILYFLNKLEDFILTIVEFLPGDAHRVHYMSRLFRREPDFGVTGVNYDFAELLARADQLS
jgi:hypothetical protein